MGRKLSRRDALKIGMAGGVAWALAPGSAWGRAPVKATQVTAVLYAAHLVAESGGFFKKEGIDVELITSPAGARSAQMVAAGQVNYVLGDTSHAQRLTEQGKATVVLYVTDKKCPYANIQTRKDLREAGLTSIDKLATMKPKTGKWKAGATAVGSGTWMYGNFILRSHSIGGGKTLNDLVEWIGVGGVKSQLGALKTEKIDLNMATPEVIIQANAEGYGAVLFDVREDKEWLPVFKGPDLRHGQLLRSRATTQSAQGRDAGLRHRSATRPCSGSRARRDPTSPRRIETLRRHHGAQPGRDPQGARLVQVGVDLRPRVHARELRQHASTSPRASRRRRPTRTRRSSISSFLNKASGGV